MREQAPPDALTFNGVRPADIDLSARDHQVESDGLRLLAQPFSPAY